MVIELDGDANDAIDVSRGGTNAKTLTKGGVLVGSGTDAVTALTVGATTEILIGGGGSADPVWTTATGSGAPVRAGAPTGTGQWTIPTIDLTGGQIAFPATAVPSADPNTLDDYEEGAWTPALEFGGGSTGITYTTQEGLYTKTGRSIILTGYFLLSNKGSSNGNAALEGLPFTIKNDAGANSSASMWWSSISFADVLLNHGNINSTKIELLEITNLGVETSLTDANFSNTSSIILSMVYFV